MALRFFKIYDNGNEYGRFKSRTPKQAASKAFTSIIKEKKQSGEKLNKKITFSIRECTRRSKCKIYTYEGTRVAYDEPLEVEIGDKKVKFKNSNIIYRKYT